MPYHPTIPSQDSYIKSYSKDDYENINKLNRVYWLFTNQDYDFEDALIVDPTESLGPLNALVHDPLQSTWDITGVHNGIEIKCYVDSSSDMTSGIITVTEGMCVLDDVFIQTTEQVTIDITDETKWFGELIMDFSGTANRNCTLCMIMDEDLGEAVYTLVSGGNLSAFLLANSATIISFITVSLVSGNIDNITFSNYNSNHGYILEIFHPRNFYAWGGIIDPE